MNPALLGSFAGLTRNLGYLQSDVSSLVQHAAVSTPTPPSPPLAPPAPASATDHTDVLHRNPQSLATSLEWFNPGTKNGIIIIGGKTPELPNPATDRGIIIIGGKTPLPGASADQVQVIRSRFEDRSKDLESQDKLGNFRIQDLMSQYNQSETLSSNIQKKLDDAHRGLIGKL
jgi:hypothetical protein